jgi:hypothetical protein
MTMQSTHPEMVAPGIRNHLTLRSDLYQLDSDYSDDCYLLQNILKSRLQLGTRPTDARANRKHYHAIHPGLQRLACSQRIALVTPTAKQCSNLANAILGTPIILSA